MSALARIISAACIGMMLILRPELVLEAACIGVGFCSGIAIVSATLGGVDELMQMVRRMMG